MYVQCYTVARSRNYWCHGDATVRFLFTAIGVAVAVNNISVLCCHENATVGSLYKTSRAAVTNLSINYYECVYSCQAIQ